MANSSFVKKSHMTEQNGRRAKKKSWKHADRWGIDETWSGTAVIYSAAGSGSWGLSGDYGITYRDESNPEELRAHRKARRRRGKSVQKLGRDKIRDHLVVIFGAEMSARRAIATLNALVDRINTEGLNIGRYKFGDFVYESTERVPRFIKK